mmetsp:Transcript_31730/g.103675  ORF Transcript_31730/g.103675 Transcript_31730/m.103675 type:complete len:371 (+) Transcript_31730:1032-2144(+)
MRAEASRARGWPRCGRTAGRGWRAGSGWRRGATRTSWCARPRRRPGSGFPWRGCTASSSAARSTSRRWRGTAPTRTPSSTGSATTTARTCPRRCGRATAWRLRSPRQLSISGTRGAGCRWETCSMTRRRGAAEEEGGGRRRGRKAAEEAAEGSEYQQYRNDHLYLKDMLVTMYEKISRHPKHEYAFSNGLHPFKTFGDVKGVGELLFPKGCNQMQKLEAECLDGYLQHGFWGETTMDAFPSWPPFSAAKVFKIKTETVDDKVVQEYLLVEKDEKMTGLMPIKDATGAVRFEVQELNELQYDAAFLRYVRKRFPKQADAFMGYLRGQYRDYCEKRGLGVHEDAVHRRLWNREQDREMTPAEIFAIFSALNE